MVHFIWHVMTEKGTSRQRSGKGAIRKRFPLQKPRREKTKLTIRYLRLFSLPLTKVGIHFGHVRMCATPYPISLIIFILDLGPSYTDKLLEFRWVQIAHLS